MIIFMFKSEGKMVNILIFYLRRLVSDLDY